MITKAKQTDVFAVYQLSVKAKTQMKQIGLNQWDGDYPYESVFMNDALQESLYIYKKEKQILGSISVLPENDPPYKELTWAKEHSMVIHRLIVDPAVQKQGIGKALFAYAISYAKKKGVQSLKVDTHPDNYRMQALIKKMGFIEVGYLVSIHRLAYELVI